MKLFSGVALRTGTPPTPSTPAAATPAAAARTLTTPVTETVNTETVDVGTQCSIVSQTQGITSDKDAIIDELIGMIMDRMISTVEEKWKSMTRQWSKKKKLKEGILQKRRAYTSGERASIIKKKDSEGLSAKKLVSVMRGVEGFEKYSLSSAKRHGRASAAKKRGPKVNEEFDQAVLGHLIYAVVKNVDNREKFAIEANICHSYAMIVRAANLAKKEEPFLSDPKVQAKKLSRPWVKSWLRRNTLRRKRTTTSQKDIPAPCAGCAPLSSC